MKFWRNAAALLIVFHSETTHTGKHSTPKDVKNEGRPGYVYENKVTMDKMPEKISAICARLKPFLQKIGVSSSPNSSKVPRTYRTGRRSLWDETPSRMRTSRGGYGLFYSMDMMDKHIEASVNLPFIDSLEVVLDNTNFQWFDPLNPYTSVPGANTYSAA